MLIAYGKEKREIVDKYIRLKPWYVGDLQKSIRAKQTIDYLNNTQPREADDPLPNRTEWSGEVFWEQCLNAELNKLNLAYEKYLPNDDKVKYTWVGINPSIEHYPTMLSLYLQLEKLTVPNNSINVNRRCDWKYEAVVEGHTKQGYRPHIHMILYTKIKPGRIVDSFSKHFKCEKNFVEVKNMKSFYHEKKNYIRGKKDDSKIKYVEQDKKEREDNNIPHLIIKNLPK